jgi:hypothetical protein
VIPRLRFLISSLISTLNQLLNYDVQPCIASPAARLPIAMPSLIQAAFAIEAIIQVITAAALVAIPATACNFLSGTNVETELIPAALLTVLQLLGIFLVAITIPIVLSIPDGPNSVERRRFTYYMLGGAEALLVPYFGLKLLQGDSGLDPAVVTQIAGGMIPFLGFRMWALWIQPEMMGAVDESKKRQ